MKDKNMVNDILDVFYVERNDDLKQWEFEPAISNMTSYIVSYTECETKEAACIAVWKNIKNKSNGTAKS